MHFTPVIRNLALQHAATACVGDICLLCELGYLFDMLQKAEGSICQATNLLKTLSSHPQGMLSNPLLQNTTDWASWSAWSTGGGSSWVIFKRHAPGTHTLSPG
jgi:PAB-dependent poly(A)-specific ribonuclease subunit 2